MSEEVDLFRFCCECKRFGKLMKDDEDKRYCPYAHLLVQEDTDAKECVEDGRFLDQNK